MSVLVDADTKVIVQGLTGRFGTHHAALMMDYGTRIVGGVTPGRGGARVHGLPVYDTVKEAVAATGATASVIVVPPPFAADAIMEAADGRIRLAVAITDGIPAQDMIRVKRYMRRYRSDRSMRLLGPNSAGIIGPRTADAGTLLGVLPTDVHPPGTVGIVSRSGTLAYEAAAQLAALGLGISTSVGIGGGPISGSAFLDLLPLFEADPDTRVVLLIDESGSAHEAEIAELIGEAMSKPVVALMGSHGARRSGPAGSLMAIAGEPVRDMRELLGAAGATLVPDAASIGATVADVLDA